MIEEAVGVSRHSTLPATLRTDRKSLLEGVDRWREDVMALLVASV